MDVVLDAGPTPATSTKTIRPAIRASESRKADFSLAMSAFAKRSAGRAESARTCNEKDRLMPAFFANEFVMEPDTRDVRLSAVYQILFSSVIRSL